VRYGEKDCLHSSLIEKITQIKIENADHRNFHNGTGLNDFTNAQINIHERVA